MRDSALNFSVLHKICTLVVLLCFIHISITMFYYVKALDLRSSFVQNQQSRSLKQSPFTSNTVFREARVDAPETKAVFISNAAKDVKELKKCPDPSPLLLGPLRIEFSIPVSLDKVRADNPNLRDGGRFRPSGCVALRKVAIIIPFRNRDEHLKFWLHYLHPILQRQQLDYGIYIINQAWLYPMAELKQQEEVREALVSSEILRAPLPIYECVRQMERNEERLGTLRRPQGGVA
ncbi:hypothetical protein SKAU_G00030670 [Synaphobranchus kaupii]|uniref:Galactosyltransferase N-terminal domain-containing protein n=1 Tax=Synaphobranchus kaupii TaxID=118154 RepID=A0A9Q1JG23_SYNKA|nr:hypothetical protein SKAU_G00030670 [Synaphobranchus kaupii]